MTIARVSGSGSLGQRPLINADLGEHCEHDDPALLASLDLANIACGGHAGDRVSILRTILLCQQSPNPIGIGAHPSYPDRPGFGRQRWAGSRSDLRDHLREQLSLFASVCEDLGVAATHVKPHGQLYHDSAHEAWLADLLLELCSSEAQFCQRFIITSPGGTLSARASTAGWPVLHEGFADRAYLATGGLAPRSAAGCVLTDPSQAAAQARALTCGLPISRLDSPPMPLGHTIDTLCIHSDTPNAALLAAAVRTALATAR